MGHGCSKEDTNRKPEDGSKPTVSEDQGFLTVDVGDANSFAPNEVKEVKVTPEFTLLVSQHEGDFYAFGAKCPHYGAPLIKGAYSNGRIKCPWHGACLRVDTGDIEDYPGGDCIPSYKLEKSEEGALSLKIHTSKVGLQRVQRPLADPKGSELYLILGGGGSGFTAARTLREFGFSGRIVLATKDQFLPYDRPKLSKSLGPNWADIKLKDQDWFKEANIELILNSFPEKVDVKNQEIVLHSRDEPLKYQKILFATGMRSRLPNSVPGIDLKGVLTLYDLADSNKIKEAVSGKTLVVMGGGFISMELIPPLCAVCEKVIVMYRGSYPYGALLGEKIALAVQQMLSDKFKEKLAFISGDSIKEILGSECQEVSSVLTDKGQSIPCGAVLYAIGSVPNTEYLKDQLTNLTPQGFIPVNKGMKTQLDNHYACGDIAYFPTRLHQSGTAQVGHWGMAQKMGRVAALNMLEDLNKNKKETIYDTVPFFWTNVSGVNLRYTGFGGKYNKILLFGDAKALKFCALYKKDSQILAVCTCNCDPIAAKFSFDIQEGKYNDDSLPSYLTQVFGDEPEVIEIEAV